MMTHADRILLTVPEACKSLGISRATLYGFISQRKIPTVKFGPGRKAGVRLRPQDLVDFADNHLVGKHPRTDSDSPDKGSNSDERG